MGQTATGGIYPHIIVGFYPLLSAIDRPNIWLVDAGWSLIVWDKNQQENGIYLTSYGYGSSHQPSLFLGKGYVMVI